MGNLPAAPNSTVGELRAQPRATRGSDPCPPRRLSPALLCRASPARARAHLTAASTCNVENIASPDNIFYVADQDALLIAEDSGEETARPLCVRG